MTALSGDKLNHIKTTRRSITLPNIAAAVTIYEFAMVAVDTSGNCRPARATASDRVVGVSKKRHTNTGSAGAHAGGVEVDRENVHRFGNSASTDAITNAHIDQPCYVVDDQTVALTDGSGTRPVAGRVAFVDSVGVHVDFAPVIR